MQETLVMHVCRDMYSLVLPINVYVSPCQNYHTMDGKDKRSLVATYMKQGGIKQLGWVANYFENSCTTSNEKSFFTGPKILQFQRFQVGMNIPPERAETLLMATLQQNWAENGLDTNGPELIQKNEMVPGLTKYSEE